MHIPGPPAPYKEVPNSPKSQRSTEHYDHEAPIIGVTDDSLKDTSSGSVYRLDLERADLSQRWTVLSLACLTLAGVFYSYDNPAALYKPLQSHMYLTAEAQFESYFNRLYSVYAFPNIFLPFFGGAVVDRMGAPISVILYSCIVLMGQLFFAIGTSLKSWSVMLLGRCVFGLGGENVVVALSVYLADWFHPGEISLALGLLLSLSRLGSVMNNIISPMIANSVSVSAALWVGVAVCAVAVIIAVVMAYIDRMSELYCEDVNTYRVDKVNSVLADFDVPDDDRSLASSSTTGYVYEQSKYLQTVVERKQVKLSDAFRFGKLFWLLCFVNSVVYGTILPFNNVASGVLLERDYFKDPPQGCQRLYSKQCSSGYLAPIHGNPTFGHGNETECTGAHISPVLPFSIYFTYENYPGEEAESWEYDVYNFTELNPSIVKCSDPFWSDGCTADFCAAQNKATEKAGQIMSIPYIVSIIISPFLGRIVDNVGYRSWLIILSPIILVFVHIVLGFTNASPIIPLAMQGFSFALFAAVIWPTLPMTVEAKFVGTAYGIFTAFQNISLTLFPLFIAELHYIGSERYIPDVEILFILLSAKAIVSCMFLVTYDMSKGGVLSGRSTFEYKEPGVRHVEVNLPSLAILNDDDDDDVETRRVRGNDEEASTLTPTKNVFLQKGFIVKDVSSIT